MSDPDRDCADCVYGPDFLDDDISHRIIVTMCDRCSEESTKAMDFLMGVLAGQRRQRPDR